MNLTNSELIARIKQLALEERRATLALIEHLEEMERRKLHLGLGFGSLYDYCTRELGMSEGSVHRRISVMRLAKSVPAIKESIESGKLTLTNAAQVHQFVRMERKAGRPVAMESVVLEMEGLSKRECERKLADLNPAFAPKEKVRVLSAEETQISFTASQELMRQLDQLRAEWSHINPHFTYAELFARMAKVALKKPNTRVTPISNLDAEPTRPTKPTSPAEAIAEVGDPMLSNIVSRTSGGEAPLLPGRRTAIPVATQRAVRARDLGCIECGSRFQLEIDHIQPRAHGGSNDAENLQLLCRPHHRRKTERETPEYFVHSAL